MMKSLSRELRLLHGFVAVSLVAVITLTNIKTILQPHPSSVVEELMSQSRSRDNPNSAAQNQKTQQQESPIFHSHSMRKTTHEDSIGRRIVDKAFAETFQEIKDICPENVNFKKCIRNASHQRGTTRPWWFQTMLRDAAPPRKRGSNADSIFGEWHELYVQDPPMKLCVIEKVGTKQWRKFQCLFNANAGWTNVTYCQVPMKVKKELELANTPRVGFIRDPLERFLSAFLDKCWDTWISDSYCKPREVFGGNNSLADKTILYDEKTFFEAYVDAMPLRWDLHFFPQSFYCDGLYRHYKNYDFVGNMDADFYDALEAFGSKFNVSDAVETVFKVKAKKNTENFGVETSAAKRVNKFYNARTVRRVLQYVSMDYVLFDIPIPKWADDILKSEEEVAES